ncbi:MAG: SIS domain-containing protein [Bacteroidales bacterium]|jgi:glucosamine--fructose-6-phosphate aminotransferase (isomerizing)
MNLTNQKYAKFALVREMLETTEVVRKFDPAVATAYGEKAKTKKGLFLTGEGSSRIFPAKRAMYDNLKWGAPLSIFTEGSTQAMEYALKDLAIFGASNSGQTKEVIRLFMKLQEEKHDALFGLTATQGTKLASLTHASHVLNCGKEDAVAATKSVIEQGLFYDAVIRIMTGKPIDVFSSLPSQIEKALTLEIDPKIVQAASHADMIYFAGRNNGVVEELTLKTNEITRKKSDFLEGTYAVHGIEEVMDKNEVVIIVEPFESEEEKFRQCLVKGVGMKVIAISSRQTSFPTVIIPDGGNLSSYVELAAGWNLLVDIGLALGIDLDKPVRARKIGNEYTL